MSWERRQATEHKCPLPGGYARGGAMATTEVTTGDIWVCDGPGGCGARYEVTVNQDYQGPWFTWTLLAAHA